MINKRQQFSNIGRLSGKKWEKSDSILKL